MENNKIIKNEVFIRGMLVGRYINDDKTTAIICSRDENKEHPNYQYVTFFGKEKEIIDGLKISDKVVVTAKAYVFRDKETKKANIQNLRLRGLTIETARNFSKRVIASIGVPIYGFKLLDCVRFTLSGNIVNIEETKSHKVFILLSVKDEVGNGFNLIPLMYSGKGSEESVKSVLNQYKKGDSISVKGFVAQRKIENENEDNKRLYQNTYFITSFLYSETEVDFSEFFDF